MQYFKTLGVCVPEYGWVPAPSYILRRHAVLDIFSRFPRGRVLEIGSGAGALFYDLAQQGFSGTAVEASEKARTLMKEVLAPASNIQIADSLPVGQEESFDYLMAFEVLEHISDDIETLLNWRSYLKSNGILLLSVPAHHSMWSDSDVYAGHYRRYEKSEIASKMAQTGFEILNIYCYGWPLSNLILPIRRLVHGRMLKKQKDISLMNERSKESRTLESGIERTTEVKLFRIYASLPVRVLILMFAKLQKLFYRRDWGTGYLVLAKKI